jgi:hypothetical protein
MLEDDDKRMTRVNANDDDYENALDNIESIFDFIAYLTMTTYLTMTNLTILTIRIDPTQGHLIKKTITMKISPYKIY